MKIYYKPTFIRQYSKLDVDLQGEIKEKVELLKDKTNHESLKVHKLHGKLSDFFSFYVNFKIRIVFSWKSDNEVTLYALGDHDVYR